MLCRRCLKVDPVRDCLLGPWIGAVMKRPGGHLQITSVKLFERASGCAIADVECRVRCRHGVNENDGASSLDAPEPPFVDEAH